MTGREVVGFKKLHGRNNEGRLRLRLRDTVTGEEYLEGDDARTTSNAGEHLTNGDEHALTNGVSEEEEDDKDAVDLLIVATGYIRNAHEWLLSSSRDLLAHKESDDESGEERGKFVVGRDYRVLYDRERVEEDCGVWLQGCCQDSHGVSYFIPPSLSFPYMSYMGMDTRSRKTWANNIKAERYITFHIGGPRG